MANLDKEGASPPAPKSIKYGLKPFNLDERCEFNDKVWAQAGSTENGFSFFVWVLRTATDLTDELIDGLTAEDIVTMANEVIEKVNKKK
jgi:hypothetical protein